MCPTIKTTCDAFAREGLDDAHDERQVRTRAVSSKQSSCRKAREPVTPLLSQEPALCLGSWEKKDGVAGRCVERTDQLVVTQVPVPQLAHRRRHVSLNVPQVRWPGDRLVRLITRLPISSSRAKLRVPLGRLENGSLRGFQVAYSQRDSSIPIVLSTEKHACSRAVRTGIEQTEAQATAGGHFTRHYLKDALIATV